MLLIIFVCVCMVRPRMTGVPFVLAVCVSLVLFELVACSGRSLDGVEVPVCDGSVSLGDVSDTPPVSLIIMLMADIHTCAASVWDPVAFWL